jgi:exodeoxyribonuclease-3
MKIAIWNINSIRSRYPHLIELLQKDSIDVILLQELKCLTEAFPYEMFEDIGYNCAVFGQKTYNGVAILSKYMIEDITLGNQIFHEDMQARYIEAFINGYKIASVYVPNGRDISDPAYEYKLKFLNILKNYLKEVIKNDEYIIGGDFNIAREDLDVYNPKAWRGQVCCTDEERALFNEIMEIGFLDHHREFSGNKPIYTWWDYRHSGFAKNQGLRLDYILTTEGVSVKACYVDLETRTKDRPSDHAPVIMEIE